MWKEFLNNSYLFGGNAPFIEELYEKYLSNPQSIPEAWRDYFDRVQDLPGATDTDVAHAPVVESFVQRAKRGEFIRKVKDKNSGVRLMGFGHRVYKNYDPRAKLMRETCHEVLNELGLHNDRLFKLAIALEKIALEDDYFVSRKLYPNVDFYSGIVQRALGIPVAMFTCIFSLARTIGWIAQWQEMITDPEYKIGRPRQLYKGAAKRDVKPLDKR